ncbi:hypothetical protein FQN49_003778 [Arthroderma sp. PD_2]|nr:hypothetical protein FQN49_003778 [Arthroderma sp. PD_2]
MPEFTPLNKVETEPMDVKMEDVPGEVEKITRTADSADGDGAAGAKDASATSGSDVTEAKDKEAEVESNGKAANGKAANGKAANGKKGAANGKKANGADTKKNGATVKEEEVDAENIPKTPKTPVTPRKRGRKPKEATDTSGAITAEEADDEAETPSKKKRGTPAKGTPSKGTPGKAGKRPLPNSIEEATDEDKMLLRMKDEENKPWSEIRAAWEEATGEAVGGSTLSGRYQRIKANFTVFTAEDEATLMQAKKDIEDKFENEKWIRISDAIENSGGKRYPAAALLKKFKELGRKKATTTEEADGDVKGEDEE